MRIQNNISALNTHRRYKIATGTIGRSAEKLSSGYRVNRAADDAAGLAISEKMRAQIRGLHMASKNSQDGISLIQTAEGAMQEAHNTLQRMRELAVQSSSDTNETQIDRAALDAEFQALMKEIDDTASKTRFNDITLLDGSLSATSASAAPSGGVWRTFSLSGSSYAGAIDMIGTTASGSVNWTVDGKDLTWLRDEVINTIGPSVVSGILDTLGLDFLEGSDIGIGLDFAEYGTGIMGMASYSYTYSQNQSTGAIKDQKLTLKITLDRSYVSSLTNTAGNFGDPEYRDDLAELIAHEMTHAVMYVASLAAMGTDSGDFPTWFKEGMAQSMAGPGNWLQSLNIARNPADNDIKNVLAQLGDSNVGSYCAGYLATMYMGYLAGGKIDVTSETIASGLKNIYTEVVKGGSLNSALASYTNYTSLSQFESAIKSGNADVVQFVKDLVAAIGTDGSGSIVPGTGSILAPLNTTDFLDSLSASSETFLKFSTAAQVTNNYPDDLVMISGGTVNGTGNPISPVVNAPDVTKPVLSSGASNRTADGTATIEFTTDEKGQYYFAVVNDGDPQPVINTDGSGTSISGGRQIVNLTGLGAGAKDVYVVVKDAAGNVSDMLKIDLAAYDSMAVDSTPPAISANSTSRASDSAATVQFTTNEKGKYYYIVKEKGDPAPADANAVRTGGTAVDITDPGKQIMSLTGLTAGEKDIYIVAEDDAVPPNLSSMLKIGLEAYSTPVAGGTGTGRGLVLQTGANQGDEIAINIESLSVHGLGLTGASVASRMNASGAITLVGNAINKVSEQRALLGALQNRMEHKIANLDSSVENLSAAESRIRDIDMAMEMNNYTKQNILIQASTAMLAQANSGQQNILSLLQ